MGAAEKLELLELLEQKHKRRAANDLNHFCRYIEIPGAPLIEDSCPDGDDCTDDSCTLHETTGSFYPDTVEPAEHHELINNTLMDVEAGKKKRVMFFMPPGSAKSTYGSVVFPTWFMGKNPNKNIISTSYGSTLAKKFGRKCRQITGSKQYHEVFNSHLKHNNRAADDWALTNESTYMCGGILSGITGNRADLLVIDDPVKGRADADSDVIRDKVWDAYLTDLRTRLKPSGSIVIIQTRWHEDDLAGRILPDNYDGESGWVTAKDGEEWYVICLQAQCEHESDPLGRKIGDWLWTSWFSVEHWLREKRIQGSRNWAALFQQKPKPTEGSLIKRAWPKRYDTPPAEFLRIVQSWDTAYKPEQINDPSVCTTWGEVRHGWYLLDVFRDRVEFPDLKRNVASLALKWKPSAILIEDKASGQSLIQEVRAHTPLPVVAIDPQGINKLDRLVAVSSLVEAGMVYLPNYAAWLPDYENELFGFPLTTHDDQVDSTSQFLKWAHSARVHLDHVSSGQRRAGVSSTETTNEDNTDGLWNVEQDNFGGFI